MRFLCVNVLFDGIVVAQADNDADDVADYDDDDH